MCGFAIYIALWPQIETPELVDKSAVVICQLKEHIMNKQPTYIIYMLFKFFLSFHLSFYWDRSFGTMARIGAGTGLQSREEKENLLSIQSFPSLLSPWHPCGIVPVLPIISFQTIEPVRPAVIYLRHSILLWQTCQHSGHVASLFFPEAISLYYWNLEIK